MTPEVRAKMIDFYCAAQKPGAVPAVRWKRPEDIPNEHGFSLQCLLCKDGVTVTRQNATVVRNAVDFHFLHDGNAALRIAQVVAWLPHC